jgi:hypothetical protein
VIRVVALVDVALRYWIDNRMDHYDTDEQLLRVAVVAVPPPKGAMVQDSVPETRTMTPTPPTA